MVMLPLIDMSVEAESIEVERLTIVDMGDETEDDIDVEPEPVLVVVGCTMDVIWLTAGGS